MSSQTATGFVFRRKTQKPTDAPSQEHINDVPFGSQEQNTASQPEDVPIQQATAIARKEGPENNTPEEWLRWYVESFLMDAVRSRIDVKADGKEIDKSIETSGIELCRQIATHLNYKSILEKQPVNGEAGQPRTLILPNPLDEEHQQLIDSHNQSIVEAEKDLAYWRDLSERLDKDTASFPLASSLHAGTLQSIEALIEKELPDKAIRAGDLPMYFNTGQKTPSGIYNLNTDLLTDRYDHTLVYRQAETKDYYKSIEEYHLKLRFLNKYLQSLSKIVIQAEDQLAPMSQYDESSSSNMRSSLVNTSLLRQSLTHSHLGNTSHTLDAQNENGGPPPQSSQPRPLSQLLANLQSVNSSAFGHSSYAPWADEHGAGNMDDFTPNLTFNLGGMDATATHRLTQLSRLSDLNNLTIVGRKTPRQLIKSIATEGFDRDNGLDQTMEPK